MDILAFEVQLNDACAEQNSWNSDSISTYVFTKLDLMDQLCEIATFVKARARFEKLLEEPFFREILKEDEEKCSMMSDI